MNPGTSMEQQFMTNILEIVEKNLHDENFGVNELAVELGMSRATLHRKVKTIIKKSVSEFIRETRLKRAHELLQQRTGTVSEIAYNVGFSSVSYFNRCFKKQYGYTPGDVHKGLFPATSDKNQDSYDKSESRQKKFLWLAMAAVLAVGMIITLIWIKNSKQNVVNKNLAILPIEVENTTAEVKNQIQWISWELINNLDKIQGTSVVPFSSIQNYNPANKTIQQIGEDLMVDYIFSGLYTKLENQAKIMMELVDISADTTIWSKVFTEFSDFDNSFTVKENLVSQITSALNINLTDSQSKSIHKKLTENQEALTYFILANNILERPSNTRINILKAKALLEKVIQLDSTFSEAYSNLGYIYMGKLRYNPNIYLSESYLDSANIFYKKALRYDDTDQQAINGLINYYEEKGMPDEANRLKTKLVKRPIKNYLYYKQEFSKNKIKLDYYSQILSFYNYMELKPDDELVPAWIYDDVSNTMKNFGFPELANYYANRFYLLI